MDLDIRNVTEVAQIEKDFQIVESVSHTPGVEGINDNGYFKLELISEQDILDIVIKRDMSHAYYTLRFCNDEEHQLKLMSAPIYYSVRNRSLNEKYHYFYAFIPKNYHERIVSYLEMQGVDNIDISSQLGSGQICMNISAGNMAGQAIRSEPQPIDLEN